MSRFLGPRIHVLALYSDGCGVSRIDSWCKSLIQDIGMSVDCPSMCYVRTVIHLVDLGGMVACLSIQRLRIGWLQLLFHIRLFIRKYFSITSDGKFGPKCRFEIQSFTNVKSLHGRNACVSRKWLLSLSVLISLNFKLLWLPPTNEVMKRALPGSSPDLS